LDLTLQYEDELQLQQEVRKVTFPSCMHCSLSSEKLSNIWLIKDTVMEAEKHKYQNAISLFDREVLLASKT
jgi:hypothetical protein